jgi:hypothetical protein
MEDQQLWVGGHLSMAHIWNQRQRGPVKYGEAIIGGVSTRVIYNPEIDAWELFKWPEEPEDRSVAKWFHNQGYAGI